MDLITLDFETFYSKEFSLSKLTTEEYIRNPFFEVIGIAVKVNNGPTEWASGTNEQIQDYLDSFDWGNSMVLAHNTMFDGAILNWRFGVQPKVWADTLSMARSIHGTAVGGSLKALSEHYKIGQKGTEVLDALGKRREDFTDNDLSRYGDYCINDVELTYDLFALLGGKYPRRELKVIDATLRMFIEPKLELDLELLEAHLIDVRDRKERLLLNLEAGVGKEDLMSNDKFAGLLRGLGVEPPHKISPATGKETYAFAKTDEGFKALQEHDMYEVQALVAARLGNKSTLEETRTQRFIDIAKRGNLPIPIRYYAAHTGRWGGSDKINIQNLPSRGPDGKTLKQSLIAPENHMLIDCDSSQIEARVLAWLAGQNDLLQSFADKEDVYIKMASRIYDNIPLEEVTKDQRFVGKTTILGAGYGMGAVKFQAQLKTFGFDMDLEEARRVINVYRGTNGRIHNLWREAQVLIENMAKKTPMRIGSPKLIESRADIPAITLPSGLLMHYPDLRADMTEEGTEYTYKTRKSRTKIYGGKFVENVCQAVARCIIAEQMLKIASKYKVVLTVHDSIVVCVHYNDVDMACEYVEDCMRQVPDWAEGLPLDCESGVGKSYGECE
jgi:hypothetical protein